MSDDKPAWQAFLREMFPNDWMTVEREVQEAKR